jgi:hypothetical protein
MIDIIFLLVLLYLYNYLVMISVWQVFIFKRYCEELEEESLRDNFVVVVRIINLPQFFYFFIFCKIIML